jgi:hypothetical protein
VIFGRFHSSIYPPSFFCLLVMDPSPIFSLYSPPSQKTRSIVKSPAFRCALEETINSLFDFALQHIKSNAFLGEDHTLRSLPLASLLPKVKATTARLIPEDLGRNPDTLKFIKSMSSGPQCTSLCLRIFSEHESTPSQRRT